MSFSPSDMPKQKSRGASCGKIAGIGCLGIVGLGFLIQVLAFGSAGYLIIPIVIGLLIWWAIRSGKKAGAAPAAQPTSGTSAVDGAVLSPVCYHTFTPEQVSGDKPLSCDCGYNIKPAELRAYLKGQEKLAALTAEQGRLVESMQQSRKSSAAAPANAQKPKAVPKPKVAKPKRNLSTQQWLVIGASILIFVAGMIFVSTNVNRLPQWAFQLITVGLAVATGFGSVMFRKLSALLASFFTAFSAAMQLATLAIIGDQLNTSFEWNTMPAWWWLVSLSVISVIGGVMAKFTRIFGWKAISLLAATAAALVLDLGVLFDKFAPQTAALHLAILSATAVGVLWLAKTLRGIESIPETDKLLVAYAQDLAKREDSSLRWFGIVASALQVVAGFGALAIAYVPVATQPLEPLSLIALAAVWIGISYTGERWSGQLRDSGEAVTELVAIARFTGHVSLGLVAVSVGSMLTDAWLAAAVTVAIAVAVNLGSSFLKPLSPTPITSLVGLGTVALAWLLWQAADAAQAGLGEVSATVMLALALALALSEWRNKVDRFAWVSSAVTGLSTVWLAFDLSLGEAQHTSWPYAIATGILVLAGAVSIPVRHLVSKRAGTTIVAGLRWLTLGVSALVAALRVAAIPPQVSPLKVSHLLPSAVVFLVYAVAALLLVNFTKFGKVNALWLRCQGYLGQLVVLFAAALVMNGHPDYGTTTLLLGALAVINYLDGWLARTTLSLQLGFGFALLALLPMQSITSGFGFVALALSSVILVTLIGLVHERVLLRRVGAGPSLALGSSLGGIVVGLIFSYLQWPIWHRASAEEAFAVQGLVSAVALGASGWVWLRVRAQQQLPRLAWWLALIYAGFASLLLIVGQYYEDGQLLRWRNLVTFLTIGLVALGNQRSRNSIWLVPVAYLSNGVTGLIMGQFTGDQFRTGGSPEPYSLWVAASVVATTVALGPVMNRFRSRLILDIPILFVALTSLLHSFSWVDSSNESLIRKLLALAIIAGFAFWRSGTEAPIVWLAAGYIGALGWAHFAAIAVLHYSGWDYRGPEPYTVLYALAVALGNWFVIRRLGERLAETRVILMLAVLTLPTLFYSVTDPDATASRTRQIVALAAVGAVALWRVSKNKPLGWIVPGYLGSIGAALTLGLLAREQWLNDFVGPELLSIPAVAALLVAHRICLPRLKVTNSWLTWGLPMGLALLPSAFDTAAVAYLTFDQLSVEQIVRVVAVLIGSVLLLTLGVRLGNLANTAVGLAGLTLLLVPNTALHSDAVVAGSQVESTALVIGVLVFIALGILKQAGVVRGRSTVFIGIPLAIVIGPALVRALMALSNPQLNSVDWWRFGILLTAGLTLLVVGALRELGGMFFPGLASVLLTALPYAFVQTKDQEWFLWVVLLVVAGAMVWVALRLEKLRKAGRNSANWLRELK